MAAIGLTECESDMIRAHAHGPKRSRPSTAARQACFSALVSDAGSSASASTSTTSQCRASAPGPSEACRFGKNRTDKGPHPVRADPRNYAELLSICQQVWCSEANLAAIPAGESPANRGVQLLL
jgi:hypothetical protein